MGFIELGNKGIISCDFCPNTESQPLGAAMQRMYANGWRRIQETEEIRCKSCFALLDPSRNPGQVVKSQEDIDKIRLKVLTNSLNKKTRY